MKHVVMFSSGAGSAVAAKRVVDRFGAGDTVLLFADVNGEHPDNYRFLHETHAWLGAELVVLDNDGATIWDVFERERFLGNSRVDPCSRVLKREPMRRWLEANCTPEEAFAHLGIDWTEEHRFTRAERFWAPWSVDCPLMWEPMLDKPGALNVLRKAGIAPPWLTQRGFPHANCGGGCVKAGIGQFKRLLQVAPETFHEWETNEERLRGQLGDVTILKDRRGGTTKPLSLRTLRLRIEAEPSLFADAEWGGCNCMTPAGDEEA